MAKAIPDGFRSITPYMRIRDAAAAIDFYKKAFGAVERFRMPGPEGKVMHAEIMIGDAIIMITEEAPDWGALSPLSLKGTTVGLHHYVTDTDAAFKKAVEAGCKPSMPPADMFCGDRFAKVTDPFGHEWTIATHKEDLSPDEMGKRAAEAMKQMCNWHRQSFMCYPAGDGYETEVTEFDYKSDGGICYEKNGVTVRHWRRSHTMDGASGYRLDWNGLSFVWTGDGKADENTVKYSKGADVFVSEMVVDNPALWGMKQGIPQLIGAFTIDAAHTSGYGVGYMARQINPRLAMATHFSFDRELIGEAVAEVRSHWKGQFAFGLDLTVVNVTKDALWIREAAVPNTANTTRPDPQWIIKEYFGGVLPAELSFPEPVNSIAKIQSPEIRDLEINPNVFTPSDQVRPWVTAWPKGLKIDPAKMFGGGPGPKKP